MLYDLDLWCTCLKDKNFPNWLSHSVSHMIVIFGTRVKWYLQQFFSFSQNSDFSGFSKFINKCQKEILRSAPPSSHVCDFFTVFPFFLTLLLFPCLSFFCCLSILLSLTFSVFSCLFFLFLSFAVFFSLSCLALNIFLSSKSSVFLSLFFLFLFNWDSLHTRLNSHYKTWSYKKKKHKMIKAYRKSL